MSTETRTRMIQRHALMTFRIYGESITLRRHQWEELLGDMAADCDNARRLREALAA